MPDFRPFLVLCSVIVSAAQADGPEGVAVNDETVSNWVRALDSDRFADRVLATERLITAGQKVIPSVVASVGNNSLEVATRAIFILQKLALSENPATEVAATQALEDLSEGDSSPSQRRAKKSLDELSYVWLERSLNELQRLGAVIHKASFSNRNEQIEAVNAIEIGNQWTGGEKGLKHLKWLRSLRGLTLIGDQVEDPWLDYVTSMHNLRTLRLKSTRVTDAGIARLNGLDLLQKVHIYYSPVTDGCVEQLGQLKHTRDVRLYGTKISQTGAERLKQLLGEGIIFDFKPGGALLGIKCQEEPCLIQFVQPNSAAAKAGLQKNDIILAYDKKTVTHFTGLRQLISKNSPGNGVNLQIRRGEQTISKYVELGEWP